MNSPSSRSILFVVAVAASLIFGSGCGASSPAQVASQSASNSSSAPAPAPTANLRSPSSAILQSAKSYTTVGPLVALQQADIAAERDGRVVKIAVEIGDHVQKGQVLALLDDSMQRASRDAQKARVASLQAQVLDWQAEQKSVEADLRRADTMRADKIISQESWEHVKYKLDETVAEVARHRADETVAEDELEAANLQLEKSRIVAPFAGVVGRSSVRIAQQVKEGDVLFWITAVAPLRILFTVPESEMAAFTNGAALLLTTPDYPKPSSASSYFPRQPGCGSSQWQRTDYRYCRSSITAVEARHVHAGSSRAMNLSEALDAALPEIPRTRLARSRPPRLNPDLIVREDVMEGEPFVGVLERGKANYFRFPPAQWQLALLFDGVRSYEEIADLYNEQHGGEITAEDARAFADNMEEADFWYKTPQEKNLALSEKLISAAQPSRRT